MGRASREKRERRDAGRWRLLAAVAAGGKLDMSPRVQDGAEVVYVHMPDEHRRSTGDVARHLLSCLPDRHASH